MTSRLMYSKLSVTGSNLAGVSLGSPAEEAFWAHVFAENDAPNRTHKNIRMRNVKDAPRDSSPTTSLRLTGCFISSPPEQRVYPCQAERTTNEPPIACRQRFCWPFDAFQGILSGSVVSPPDGPGSACLN